MTLNDLWKDESLLSTLKKGGIVVMPTDTLYGIVGKALDMQVVERIYKLRKRAPDKPCIILIGDIGELKNFSIILSKEQKKAIEKYALARTVLASALASAEDPVSIVLDCADERFSYLHRGTKTLALRLPAQAGLRKFLKETGPLIAPSANTEGLPPSETIDEAKKYFGDRVDLYLDGGEIKGKASKVVRLHQDGSVTVLRA